MIDYMNKIAEQALQFLKNKWKHVFDELDKLDVHWNVYEKKTSSPNLDPENEIINDDDMGDSEQAMETNEYEPASAEFLNAIGKENVFYSFLNRLNKSYQIGSR